MSTTDPRTSSVADPRGSWARRGLGILAVAVGLVLAFSVFGRWPKDGGRVGSERPSIDASGPEFLSVERLGRAAQVVVVVEMVGIVAREVDRGGDPEVDPVSGEPIPGFPVMFVGARVESVIDTPSDVMDRVEVGSVIPILRFDSSAVQFEGESELADGDRFVLFLEYRAPESAPGISSVDGFFTVLGGDDGVFHIIDGRAISRGRVQSLLEADVENDIPDDQVAPRLDVDLSDLLAVVEEVRPG
jgi:hypothetical protein